MILINIILTNFSTFGKITLLLISFKNTYYKIKIKNNDLKKIIKIEKAHTKKNSITKFI